LSNVIFYGTDGEKALSDALAKALQRHYKNRSILHDNGNISQNMISFYKLELFIE
jgi:hypothetical protein